MVLLCQSYMVMSDKTAIAQLKISRIMILTNIGGLRIEGGTYQAHANKYANVEMMYICLGFGLEML